MIYECNCETCKKQWDDSAARFQCDCGSFAVFSKPEIDDDDDEPSAPTYILTKARSEAAYVEVLARRWKGDESDVRIEYDGKFRY